MNNAMIELSVSRDGEDLASLVAYGRFWRDGDEFCVEFEEDPLLTGDEDRVQIRVLGQEQVRILAAGDGTPASFILERAPKVHSLSDDNNSSITLVASQIRSDLDDDGGMLFVRYNLVYDRSYSEETELTVTVRLAAQNGAAQ